MAVLPVRRGSDEIEFDQSLASSTITTSEAQFEITSPVNITGPVEGDPTGLTISGGGLYRTLWIEGSAPGSIEGKPGQPDGSRRLPGTLVTGFFLVVPASIRETQTCR